VTLFFLAIGTGMACGLGAVPVAAVGVAVVWALLVALDWGWKPEPPAPNPAWNDDAMLSEDPQSVGLER
jgi:hypothetical protein